MKKILLSMFAALSLSTAVHATNVNVTVNKSDYAEEPQISGFSINDANDILTGDAALEYGVHGTGIWSITFYVKEGTTPEALDASVTSDSFTFTPEELTVTYYGTAITGGSMTAPISEGNVLFIVGDMQIYVYYEEEQSVNIPSVNNHGYQIPNSDFENWVSDKEPGNGWNSFASATGDYATFATMSPAPVKVEGRNGGSAVRLNSKDLWLAKANGNLTTGTINMGNMTPTDTTNHNYTDLDNEGHYLLFAGQPDSVCLYAKFISGGSENGRGRFILHDKYEYHDPELSGDNNHKIAEAAVLIPEAGEWTRFCAPFTYTGLTAAEGEQYMLASITTNPVAGGSDKDTLFIDDIAMIYNSKLNSIAIADVALEGFDKETYSYTVNGDVPQTADVVAVSDGKGAQVSTEITDNVLTITVKGNDIAVNPENVHTYTVTFDNSSAIDAATSENIAISYANGFLTIKGATGEQAEVYTLTGQLIAQFTVGNTPAQVSLRSGAAYIVKTGNTRQVIIAQ